MVGGIVARKYNPQIVEDSITMMQFLQSRGQEASGVAYSDGERVWIEKGLGTVENFFSPEVITDINNKRPFSIICHNRYSTTGAKSSLNVHPFWLEGPSGRVALVVNGDTPSLDKKKEQMNKNGSIFFTDSDTEYALKYIVEKAERKYRNILVGIKDYMLNVNASYSAALILREKLFIFRDPYANRPLFCGYKSGDFVFASEDSALKKIGAHEIQEVKAGTIIEVGINGKIKEHEVFSRYFCQKNRAKCIFEFIYFARPETNLGEDMNCAYGRQRLAAKLYQICNVRPDVVFPVPDSGNQGSVGYAIASNSHLQIILNKDSSIARTFIMPDQGNRELKARLKYNPIVNLIKCYGYEKIMVIDDSIVRSTTMRAIIQMLRIALKQIEWKVRIIVGILSPPIKHPCYYGIDMKSYHEIAAANKNIEEIRKYIGADELYYLSLEGLDEVIEEMGVNPDDFCKACFNGTYPIFLD